ncbi:MAG TPA: TIGR04282 family arsenosugar biosynthesis glycosyltransferase [Hyphomicrobiaceae bacterium]|nr:TIGR04282 family arsenosugar biosynthesis glycosyltransferase [Hyphomicrobiaceae bacterium]
MAKASIVGATKTRLVPPLTFEEAAALNTAFVADAADKLRALANGAGVAGYMAYTPRDARDFFRRTASGVGLVEAAAPDLGQCMRLVLSSLLANHGSACVFGSDCPTLPVEYLVQAAEALRKPGDRVVIGPSCDGGYYLIGVKQAHRRLFEAIDWSTDRVLRQTLERAGELGLEAVVLPTWYDVDEREALCTLVGELFEGRRPRYAVAAPPAHAAATRRQLQAMLAGSDLRRRLSG